MSPLPTNAPQTAWQVTGQVEVMAPGPGGTLVDGIKVMFTTGKGVQGSVTIPRARYNPTNVRAEVAAHAAQLDQVQDATG